MLVVFGVGDDGRQKNSNCESALDSRIQRISSLVLYMPSMLSSGRSLTKSNSTT